MDIDQKSRSKPLISVSAATGATPTVAVRVQPLRSSKALPALVSGILPEKTGVSEESFQIARVKQFGHLYGLRFNALITAWQLRSQDIRRFFLEGSMVKFNHGRHLQWNADGTALDLKEESRKGWYEQLLELDAFWKVMTKGPLSTFTRDTVLYRGVGQAPGYQLPDKNFVVQNVLTNWTSNPVVAMSFASSINGALYAATFPKGSRYLYTGENYGEFEFIIPGGMFQLSKYPKLLAHASKEMTLLEFAYIPGTQFFPWPGKSTSPSTRATYQKELETKVIPDIVANRIVVSETTTAAQITQQFDKFKNAIGYTGNKTITDYPSRLDDLLDTLTPERAKQLRQTLLLKK